MLIYIDGKMAAQGSHRAWKEKTDDVPKTRDLFGLRLYRKYLSGRVVLMETAGTCLDNKMRKRGNAGANKASIFSGCGARTRVDWQNAWFPCEMTEVLVENTVTSCHA